MLTELVRPRSLKNVVVYDIQDVYLRCVSKYLLKKNKNIAYLKEYKNGYLFSLIALSYFIKLKKPFFLTSALISPRFNYLIDRVIFLNHGWGTKKTPANWWFYSKNSKKMLKGCENVHHNTIIVCLSDFDSTYYMKNVNYKNKSPKFIPLGLPRNDFLVLNKNNLIIRNKIMEHLGLKNNYKIFLYAPTHREFYNLNYSVMYKIIKEFNNIDNMLDKKAIKILFRPHAYLGYFERQFNKYRNIFYLCPKKYPDVRPFMIASDALLTDYSSIFVDYLLLEKPIVFYPFDLTLYSSIRGLAIDFNNKIHTPGPKITSLNELLHLDSSDFKEYDLNASKHFFHKYVDGESTKRISEFVIRLMEE